MRQCFYFFYSVPNDYITLSDDAVVRKVITKPNDIVDTIAPKTVYEGYKAKGYSISADALFIAYRTSYEKVSSSLVCYSLICYSKDIKVLVAAVLGKVL